MSVHVPTEKFVPSPDQFIVGLDYPDPWQAMDVIQRLLPTGCMFKLGLELFCACAVHGVRPQDLKIPSGRLMLDLKLWDIPNTVCSAALVVCRALRPRYLTVPLPFNHPSFKAVVALLAKECPETTVLGITVLTSMDDHDVVMASNGGLESVGQAILYFTDTAIDAKGQHAVGLVMSAVDIEILDTGKVRQEIDKIVTPGMRMPEEKARDQKRIATPAFAFAAGADHIVQASYFTKAPDPLAAMAAVREHVANHTA